MITRLKQWWCSHRFSISRIRRVSPAEVECPCSRCGKVVRAPYGIALPGKLER